MIGTAFVLVLIQAPPQADARELEAEGRWEEAVAAWRRVPEPPSGGRLSGADERRGLEAALAIRGEAQWGIAHGLLRLGRDAEALVELEKAREVRLRRSWCGNAFAQFRAEILLAEGIALERLGRHAEAVGKYFDALEGGSRYLDPRVPERLVRLYRAAGREDALREELVRRDAALLRNSGARDPEAIERILELSPTRPVRRVWEGTLPPAREGLQPCVSFPPVPKGIKLP